MKLFLSPKLQISLCFLSLVLSVVFIAVSLGLLPSEEIAEEKAELQARAAVSEALAVQLATLASRNDAAAIKDTIDAVASAQSDILSIGIRDNEGKLLAASPDHAASWRDEPNGKSTAAHVQVPLLNGYAAAGRIEIAFGPLHEARSFLGISSSLTAFIGLLGAGAFIGSYVILSRTMRELDPSRAIPDRVKAAFDTLAEGVLIMDGDERVLMSNLAFSDKILGAAAPKLGSAASDLPWLSSASSPLAPDLTPWRMTVNSQRPVLGTAMAIRNQAGELRRLIVNATRIVDGDGATRGVIATFDDITALHRTNEQLSQSIQQLNLSQRQISEHNEKLKLLASRDPLTGCLNRRTFFEKAELLLFEAVAARLPMSFVMIDVDHFKKINDGFGHLIGDEVLVGLSDLLLDCCRSPHLVGRYGGEEFCVALVQLSDADVDRVIEGIRRRVAAVGWQPNGKPTTVSIGIASLDNDPSTLAELVKRADEALYAAKAGGRNCSVNWQDISASPAIAIQ